MSETVDAAEQAGLSRRQFLAGLAGATGLATLGGNILSPSDVMAAEARQDMDSVLLSRLPQDHFIQHGPTHRRNVALTIDDWWANATFDYLPETLDMAKDYDAKLTLFPVGSVFEHAWEDTPNLRKHLRHNWGRVPDEGHVIGNHTQTHHQLSGLPTSEIQWEMHDQHKWLDRVLGYRYREHLMRPPGGDGGFPSQGSRFTRTLNAVKSEGYYMTMWSIDSNAPDGEIVTANEDERFLNKIYNNVRNGSIILIHPTTLSLNGLHTLMHHLKQEGYGMVTVPQLFEPREYWTSEPITSAEQAA